MIHSAAQPAAGPRWSPTADPRLLTLEHEVLRLTAELAAVGDLEMLARRLVEGLRELLDLRAVSLVGFEGRGWRPRLLASTLAGAASGSATPVPVPPDALLALRRVRGVHRASDLAARAPELVRCVAGLAADWVIPLVRRDELAGLLVVAPKVAGGSCSGGEVALLHRVSFQIAALLEGDRLLEVANHDGLTGALRRGAVLCLLEREVQRMFRYGGPLAVLMLDLDRFRRINDRFGHLEGDVLLRRVAAALAARLRTTDLLGRYGGEEFLVVLPQTGAEPARAVAEALRRTVAGAASEIAGTSVSITLSIGATAAEGVQRGRAPGSHELLTAADAALYRAKREGRDRAVFLPAPSRLVTGPADRAQRPA